MTIQESGFIPRARKAHDRRFSVTKNFGVSSLVLPSRFSVEDSKGDVNGPRDQLRNFCTAATGSEIGADEHGKKMSMKFQALAISLVRGEPLYQSGATIDEGMKAGRIYGFLPLEKEPKNIQESEYEPYICDPANWPKDSSHTIEALKYKIPGGDFVVDGPYDHFDNFRSTIYAHKPDNGISLGIPWRTSISLARDGIVSDPLWGDTFWHDVDMKGWETINGEERIRVRSWDRISGDHSYFFFNRKQFNALLSTAGAIGKIYKNIDESVIEDLKERDLSIYEQIINLLYVIRFKLATSIK